MIISKICLQNWKNFQKVDIDLTKRVFVIGANASGKSNFLDAIRFIRDVVKESGGLKMAVKERGGISSMRCLSARRESFIQMEFHLKEKEDANVCWKYFLKFTQTGGGIFPYLPSILEEKVWSQKDNKWILERKKDSVGEDSETLKFTHLEQINSNTLFREVYNFFKDIRYLHIIPHLIREADSYSLTSNKEDYYGRNLIEKINKANKKTQKSYLNKIQDVLEIAVPQLKELKIEKDGKGIPHLQAVYEHWRASGAYQLETQFSDGTLRLIGFMWALLDGSETILLEEPELYLHTAIIKKLPEFISRFQRKKSGTRQVIISTHSYDLLSGEGIGTDEILLLKPEKEGTIIERADNIREVKQYIDAGFNIADAVVSRVAPPKIEEFSQLKIWD